MGATELQNLNFKTNNNNKKLEISETMEMREKAEPVKPWVEKVRLHLASSTIRASLRETLAILLMRLKKWKEGERERVEFAISRTFLASLTEGRPFGYSVCVLLILSKNERDPTGFINSS